MKRSRTLKTYVSTLLRCRDEGRHPTRAERLRLCPHLSKKEIEDNLMQGEVIALPPVRAGGECFVAWYCPADDFCSPAFMSIWSPEDPKSKDVCSPVRFVDKAIAYAKVNWPEEAVVEGAK